MDFPPLTPFNDYSLNSIKTGLKALACRHCMTNHHFDAELEGELLWETSADENCSEKNVVYVKGKYKQRMKQYKVRTNLKVGDTRGRQNRRDEERRET